MLKRFVCSILIMFLFPAILSGCWDKIEIDQRGFVTVILIDMAPTKLEGKEMEEVKSSTDNNEMNDKLIKVTFVLPKTVMLSGEGGGGEEQGFLPLTAISNSIEKASSIADSRISRRLYFGHTQVAVFGEALLKDPEKVKQVLDYFDRNPQFNRTLRVVAAKGETSKIAELKPKGELLLFRYIRSVLENSTNYPGIVDVKYNDFIGSIRGGGEAILPLASADSEDLKIAGAAVIKDFMLIGTLSEYETFYYSTLMNKRKGGIESVKLKDTTINFVANNTSKKTKLLNNDIDNLEIGIDIEVEGSILSNGFEKNLFDDTKLLAIEDELNKKANKSSEQIIAKLQKEYNVDVLKVGEYLRKFHPSVWQEVKDDWDNKYQKIKITPKVENKIRRVGTSM